MNLETLCEQLGVNSTSSEEHKLHLLESWCLEHVSTDMRMNTGTINERYTQYLELAQNYLEHFAPYIPQNLNIPVPEFEGKTTIEAASYFGLDRVLVSLAPSSELVNTPNSFGLTPLHIAAIEGNFNTAHTLLNLGADPAKRNNQLQMPVFNALQLPVLYEDELRENKIKIYRLLKETAPETVNNQDSNGDTVLQKMAIHNFSSLMNEVLSTNPNLAYIKNNHSHYPIHTSILNNTIICAGILLRDKEMAQVADSKGRVPLHYAARYSGADMVALCSEASTIIDPVDFEGKTPFMLAAEVGNLAAMQALLDHGANVQLTDNQGYTALHLAVYQRAKSAVRWLLEHTKIDVNAVDPHHQTALSMSERAGTDELSELLLNSGAISSMTLRQ
ncbi:ankyrin repeat domain-containing protein [Legionella quateirensis]|uniref:Ankyrin repeat protein n=1 Tax=Legionella quateirensis TaxID=45072 RepID=A0A378KYE6_9GAMM|nr:ankyrin repeat domain-containing protein [Legionella quateirensis]KTD54692.1 Ankyrin repeat protein [Legionella quateirensis]STY16870.1 Ankyrin repeat protein [Legionella quateirensis]